MIFFLVWLVTRYFAMLSIAIAILHNHHICHHDLKPKNIFRDEEKNFIVGSFVMINVIYLLLFINRRLWIST
jgi:serine/threonine protein kinase